MLNRVTLIHGCDYEKFIERSDSMFNDYTTSDTRENFILSIEMMIKHQKYLMIN